MFTPTVYERVFYRDCSVVRGACVGKDCNEYYRGDVGRGRPEKARTNVQKLVKRLSKTQFW